MSGFYIKTKPDGKEQGPFTGAQLKKLKAQGKLKPHHQVSKDRKSWREARTITALNFGNQQISTNIDTLLKKLHAPSWFFWISKEKVIADLGKTRSDAAVEPLVEMLKDFYYRDDAVAALGHNGRLPELFIPAIANAISPGLHSEDPALKVIMQFKEHATLAIKPLILKRIAFCKSCEETGGDDGSILSKFSMSPFDVSFRNWIKPVMTSSGKDGNNIAFNCIADFLSNLGDSHFIWRCDCVAALRELIDMKTILPSDRIRDELLPLLKDLREQIKDTQKQTIDEDAVQDAVAMVKGITPDVDDDELTSVAMTVLKGKRASLPLEDIQKLISRLHRLLSSA